MISPADGVICSIGQFQPPPELGLGMDPMLRVCVFMNVFDVHVNRAPVTGRISRIAYKPGLFLNADLDKASEDNERNGAGDRFPPWPCRRGADRGAGRAAHRLLRAGGPEFGRRRSFRPDPFRLARRCLSAGGRARSGRARLARHRRRNRAGRLSATARPSVISRSADMEGETAPASASGPGAPQAARPAQPAFAFRRSQCRDPAGALRRPDRDPFRGGREI